MSEAAMEAAERPAWRISFRQLGLIVLGLSAAAFVAGRYIYVRYGGYRPLALAHVPSTMRYRARVSVADPRRVPLLAPLLAALDPRHTRLPSVERKLGVSVQSAARELAFGAGPASADFVLVLGLQRRDGLGTSPARAVCEALSEDGIRSEPTAQGCSLADGAIVADTPDGALVVASRARLVEGLLGVPDLGDRLGFSGPSARGTAPDVDALGNEARALGELLLRRYP